MSEDKTTEDQPLAIGQVWVPRKGKARCIVRVPHAPGVHYLTLPDARTGWCDGSFMFRDWIRRTHATLQQDNPVSDHHGSGGDPAVDRGCFEAEGWEVSDDKTTIQQDAATPKRRVVFNGLMIRRLTDREKIAEYRRRRAWASFERSAEIAC